MIITQLERPRVLTYNEVDMLRDGRLKVSDGAIVWRETGLVWLEPILWHGLEGDDIIAMVDEMYDLDNEIFPIYTHDEAFEDTFIDERYLPINGGEYYTNMISKIEYIGG